MELAPLTRKDFKEALALMARSSPGFDFVDAAVLEKQTFGDPDHDISYLLKAVEKKQLAGLALAVARRTGPQERTGWVKYFGVLPKFRRRGLGQALFSELERRFQKRGVRELRLGACPPPFIQNGVPVGDTASACFLLGRGYAMAGTVIDMTLKLPKWKAPWTDGDKAVLKASKVRQAKSPADQKAVQEMVGAAFPNWLLELQMGLKDGAVYVAEDGGRIAAFCCANASNPGFYGPTGTLPSSRGKGLGRVLLFKSLEHIQKQGFKEAKIPWVGPIPFYARNAGAELGPVFWQFAKRL